MHGRAAVLKNLMPISKTSVSVCHIHLISIHYAKIKKGKETLFFVFWLGVSLF